jgi:hypothetical protein
MMSNSDESLIELQQRVAAKESEIELAMLNLSALTSRQQKLKTMNELVEWRLRMLRSSVPTLVLPAVAASLHDLATKRQNEERIEAKTMQAVQSAIAIITRLNADKSAEDSSVLQIAAEIMRKD